MPLPFGPPLAPMLARLARSLPAGAGWVFEPKWDGFRCLAFCAGAAVDLRSRNDRPLARYFPEVVAALAALPEAAVLDGELLVASPDRFDFNAVLTRLHPASSRVARLAAETPATFVVFDVLAVGDRDLRAAPFARRRSSLRELLQPPPPPGSSAVPLLVTPATAERAVAETWLEQFRGGGLDGVVAKHEDAPYQPGKRAMVKVKHEDTADCVVAGLRWFGSEQSVGSLLLGLFDEAGALRHVGVVTAFPRAERAALATRLQPFATALAGHPWEQGFALEGGAVGRLKGAAGRWVPGMEMDWLPLRPELVCEVAYDQVDGIRFRHPARFRRWRPDRDPSSCTVDQIRLPPPPWTAAGAGRGGWGSGR